MIVKDLCLSPEEELPIARAAAAEAGYPGAQFRIRDGEIEFHAATIPRLEVWKISVMLRGDRARCWPCFRDDAYHCTHDVSNGAP